MQIFYKTILGNATDIANVCQMISYSSLEKDLICNENLNLNLEWNTSLTAACFSKNNFCLSQNKLRS